MGRTHGHSHLPRHLVVATTCAVLLGLLTPMATAGVVVDPTVIRYAGTNRYGTAAAISQGDFPVPVDTVFVSVGTNFPDAVAGAAVAGKLGAPLLLVTATGIPGETASELTRLAPNTIVILGGTAAIPAGVATALNAYAPSVIRLAGSNRYATAVAISQYGFPAPGSADEVVIATGNNFADALAGGPLAEARNGPVLLTDPAFLPSVVADEIVRLDPDRIVVLGGTAAVSQAVFDQLTAIQPNTVRIAGNNRYLTSVAISAAAFPGADRAYIATGLNFPDALAGAAAAASRGAPVMLVPTSDLPSYVAEEITRLGAKEIVLLGGRSVVTTTVQAEAAALVGTTTEVIVNLTNSPPPGFEDAVAELFLSRPANIGLTVTVSGIATFAAAFDGHVGVVTANSFAGTDVVLLASDDGTNWRVAGTHLATLGENRVFGESPRFVTVIGADDAGGPDPLYSWADSVHIISLVAAPAGSPSVAAGAIVGIPRNTVVHVPYLDTDHDLANDHVDPLEYPVGAHDDDAAYCTGTDMCDQLNHTMRDKSPESSLPKGPAVTVEALELETGIDIEGYFHTGMGTITPGFQDLVDAFITAYSIFTFLVPYPVPGVPEGQTTVDGGDALSFARHRFDLPRGDQDRSLAQGLLIKAAIANVQPLEMQSTPGLLAIMDDFVTTDVDRSGAHLCGDDVLPRHRTHAQPHRPRPHRPHGSGVRPQSRFDAQCGPLGLHALGGDGYGAGGLTRICPRARLLADCEQPRHDRRPERRHLVIDSHTRPNVRWPEPFGGVSPVGGLLK